MVKKHNPGNANGKGLIKRSPSSVLPKSLQNLSAILSSKDFSLKIPERLAEGLVNHARERAPARCWGVITGQGREADAFHRLDEATAYCWGMASEDLRQVQEQYQTPEVLAFYHSHSGEAGCPVILDTPNMANWPEALRHVVISLENAECSKLQVFRRQEKRFTEEILIQVVRQQGKLSFKERLLLFVGLEELLDEMGVGDHKPNRIPLQLPPGSSGHE